MQADSLSSEPPRKPHTYSPIAIKVFKLTLAVCH